MRKANFLGHEVSRLIVGDNPFGGHSYIDPIITGAEMKSFYYDTRKLYNTYFELEEAGVDCMMPLANPVYVQVLKEYKRDGGKMKLIFQSYSSMLDEPMARQLIDLEPIGVYVTGSRTDLRYEQGNIDDVKTAINTYRSILQVPIGLGSHYPNVIEQAEAEDWGADFYLACLHNLRRGRVGEESGFITGKTKVGVKFFQEDRKPMLDVIAKTQKPCIAFKIFAGGNLLLSENQDEVRETVKNCYREVYSSIKPNDLAVIGIFNKYKNQLKEDLDLFHEVMDELEA